jgi:hypothetical protein
MMVSDAGAAHRRESVRRADLPAVQVVRAKQNEDSAGREVVRGHRMNSDLDGNACCRRRALPHWRKRLQGP